MDDANRLNEELGDLAAQSNEAKWLSIAMRHYLEGRCGGKISALK